MGNSAGVIGNLHNYRSRKRGKLGQILVLHILFNYTEGKIMQLFCTYIRFKSWIKYLSARFKYETGICKK